MFVRSVQLQVRSFYDNGFVFVLGLNQTSKTLIGFDEDSCLCRGSSYHCQTVILAESRGRGRGESFLVVLWKGLRLSREMEGKEREKHHKKLFSLEKKSRVSSSFAVPAGLLVRKSKGGTPALAALRAHAYLLGIVRLPQPGNTLNNKSRRRRDRKANDKLKHETRVGTGNK